MYLYFIYSHFKFGTGKKVKNFSGFLCHVTFLFYSNYTIGDRYPSLNAWHLFVPYPDEFVNLLISYLAFTNNQVPVGSIWFLLYLYSYSQVANAQVSLHQYL